MGSPYGWVFLFQRADGAPASHAVFVPNVAQAIVHPASNTIAHMADAGYPRSEGIPVTSRSEGALLQQIAGLAFGIQGSNAGQLAIDTARAALDAYRRRAPELGGIFSVRRADIQALAKAAWSASDSAELQPVAATPLWEVDVVVDGMLTIQVLARNADAASQRAEEIVSGIRGDGDTTTTWSGNTYIQANLVSPKEKP